MGFYFEMLKKVHWREPQVKTSFIKIPLFLCMPFPLAVLIWGYEFTTLTRESS